MVQYNGVMPRMYNRCSHLNNVGYRREFDMVDFVKKYWYLIVLCIIIIIGCFANHNKKKEFDGWHDDFKRASETLSDLNRTLEVVSQDFDPEQYTEIVYEATVSANAIGAKLIELDNEMTSMYKANPDDTIPVDEPERSAWFERLDVLKQENARLRGVSDTDHHRTWQLNPEWNLELESVVTYRSVDKFPIVFGMTTKDDRKAGLVYAEYNVQDDTISNVSTHYTQLGLSDEVDAGGM